MTMKCSDNTILFSFQECPTCEQDIMWSWHHLIMMSCDHITWTWNVIMKKCIKPWYHDWPCQPENKSNQICGKFDAKRNGHKSLADTQLRRETFRLKIKTKHILKCFHLLILWNFLTINCLEVWTTSPLF